MTPVSIQKLSRYPRMRTLLSQIIQHHLCRTTGMGRLCERVGIRTSASRGLWS